MTGFLALFLLAILFIACMAGLAYLVARAPVGWQGPDGFYLGEPDSLAHCDICDLWLKPNESCLHIPGEGQDFKFIHDASRERADALTPAQSLSFHSAASTSEGQRKHG